MNKTIYNTLYDWQKPFVDNVINKFEYSERSYHGYYLRMGIGKTKIMTATAEMRNSDCIIVTSILDKVTEEFEEGSFGDELRSAGYKVFFSHLLKMQKPLKTERSKPGEARQYFMDFEQAILNKEKIAYVCNYDTLITDNGYIFLNVIANAYKNISWIFDESHNLKSRKSKISKRVASLFKNKKVPQIKPSTNNYFRSNVKNIILGTGTPFTKNYSDFYQQLVILGMKMSYKEFKNNFLEIELEEKGYNIFAETIKGHKNEDQLFELMSDYVTFAKTENYYEFLPERRLVQIKVPRSSTYDRFSDHTDNENYKVLDEWIADTPSLYKLRLRQLASGFLGNSDFFRFYSTLKANKLYELLESNDNNHIIFYTYTPELYAIIDVAERAGFVYDLWSGIEKDATYYNDDSIKKKKLIIANTKSGSVGINRQKYNSVIFYSLPDTYDVFDQAIARVDRLGQKAEFVDIYLLITVGSVENNIYRAIKKGQDYDDKAFEEDYLYKLIE